MNITSNYSFNTPNFKAFKVAQISTELKGRGTNTIDIYELTRSDRGFIERLNKQTNFKKLFPKLTETLQERWQSVFDYCIECACNFDNKTYIAMHDNKPCGIMTYTKGNSLFLEGLCSIPQTPNKKIPFVGDRLLYQIFLDAKEQAVSDIKLEAVNDGPYDAVKKYKKRGFKEEPTTSTYTNMRCNKHKIKEQLKEFPFMYDYKALKPEITSLDKFLD